ncbi:MAG: hypothetical protein ACRDBG_24030 [Waterburya sp.]
MPGFNYSDIFGSGSSIQVLDYTPLGLTIDTGDIMGESQNGDLPDGIGLTDASSPTATQIFYGILMILMQNQAEAINTDPTQKVYVTDAGKSIATGTRDGQVKRSFTVSFFIDAGLAGTPSIDQIDS